MPTAPPHAARRPSAALGRTFLDPFFYALSCVAMDFAMLGAAFLISAEARAWFSRLVYPLPPLRLFAWPDPGMLYALGAGITMAGLVYEGMYNTGLAMLDRTERMVKSLSWSLFLLILISFTVHRSASISRLSIFVWYVVVLLLMVLFRPLWEKRVVRTFKIHSNLALLGGAELPADTWQSLSGFGFQMQPGGFPPPESAARQASALVYFNSELADQQLAEMENHYHELGMIAPAAQITALGSRPVNLRGSQIFVISHPLRHWLNRALKRAVDIAGAQLLLLASLPLGLLIAGLIRLESRGPVLFSQRRLGKDGRPFVIWKFRTMAIDAEQRLAAVLAADPQMRREYLSAGKLKNDPRITRLGSRLRNYSLDELPQFWNVLIGDMSLVGPRPFCFEHERELLGSAYGIISTVRPGITGIWQTSGRSDTPYHSRRDFDVYYVRCWSLWLDLALLLKTLQAVLMPGAY